MKNLNGFLKAQLKKKMIKKVLALMGPWLFIIIGVFFVVLIVIGVTYSTLPLAGGDLNMDGVYDERDQEITALYTDMADDWNIYDTWLDKGGGSGPDINDFLDSIGRNTQDLTQQDIYDIKETLQEQQEYDNMINVHSMIDRDGKDRALSNNWGSIHGFLTYYMYIEADEKIPEELKYDFIKEMHPKFKYRTSTRTVYYENEDGDCESTSYTEYLLTEADTMRGHFAYNYEWVDTRGEGCSGSVYEELSNTRELSSNRWERLETYLMAKYDLETDEIEGLRIAYLNSENAFFKQQEELAWLLDSANENTIQILPFAVIPQNVKQLCQAAGEKYGIDSAILMAIAWKETGGRFDPTAYNADSGATGPMQFMPSTFEAYKQDGDSDGSYNIYSFADSIYTAAHYIKSNMDASGLPIPDEDFQNRETEQQKRNVYIDALQHYGGVYGSAEARSYAESVYQLSYNFIGGGSTYVFPLYGFTLTTAPITLPFNPGMDTGVHSGNHKGHFGIDFGVPRGTPVLAVISGKIVFAGNEGDAGNYIQLLGDDGLMHEYEHLDVITIRKGEIVKAGDQIGNVGSTGYSTGPHLHYGIRQWPYRYHIDNISPLPILSESY